MANIVSAGKNYEKTIQMLENNGSECYPMEIKYPNSKSFNCCDSYWPYLMTLQREFVNVKDTLKAGNAAGKNYEKTIQMLEENNGSECYPMEKLLIVVIGYYHLPESWWVEEILVPFMIHGKVIK